MRNSLEGKEIVKETREFPSPIELADAMYKWVFMPEFEGDLSFEIIWGPIYNKR